MSVIFDFPIVDEGEFIKSIDPIPGSMVIPIFSRVVLIIARIPWPIKKDKLMGFTIFFGKNYLIVITIDIFEVRNYLGIAILPG